MSDSDLEGIGARTLTANDEAELAKLGYKQELKREWSLMQVCTLLLAHLTLLSFTERFLVDRILASASQLFLVCFCPPCAITRL